MRIVAETFAFKLAIVCHQIASYIPSNEFDSLFQEAVDSNLVGDVLGSVPQMLPFRYIMSILDQKLIAFVETMVLLLECYPEALSWVRMVGSVCSLAQPEHVNFPGCSSTCCRSDGWKTWMDCRAMLRRILCSQDSSLNSHLESISEFAVDR